MEPIGTASRSTSSMGLLVTIVLAEMDGFTHGPKQTISPITGVGTTISQRFASKAPLLGGTSKTPTTTHPTTTRAWMKRTPSTHRWKILPRCRSTNWLRSSGIFSTLTGMETELSWNDWKLLMKILKGIRFRFLDLKIWPTLPVIWRRPLIC